MFSLWPFVLGTQEAHGSAHARAAEKRGISLACPVKRLVLERVQQVPRNKTYWKSNITRGVVSLG